MELESGAGQRKTSSMGIESGNWGTLSQRATRIQRQHTEI